MVRSAFVGYTAVVWTVSLHMPDIEFEFGFPVNNKAALTYATSDRAGPGPRTGGK